MRDDHRKARLAYLLKTDYANSRSKFMAAHPWVSKSRLSQVLGKEPFAEDAGFEWAQRIGLPKAWFNSNWPTPKEARSNGWAIDKPYPRVADAGENAAASDSEFVDIPRKRVKLSAGRGKQAYIEDAEGVLKFRVDFLRSVGAKPNFASVVKVEGTSMEPTIPDGAVVLVSESSKEGRNKKIFALRIGDELLVKRLRRDGERWIAQSDNAEFPDIAIDGNCEIIGRVLWMGTTL